MCRRNVGHVERRILAEQDDIEISEVFCAWFRKLEMGAVAILDLQALATRQKLIAVKREIGWRVIEDIVSALLRFEQNGERRIAANVDAIDWIHLHGNAKIHVKRLEAAGGADALAIVRLRRLADLARL
jgi:hypothetical protein